MERVSDYIIRRLTESGVRHIFMISGRGILYLTDAVAKNKEIQAIPTYHEQGASYAAMAYASASEGIGACLVSTGCAAANAVTACLCAYQDNLPVVFVSGQNMLRETTRFTGLPIRTYGSQEADIIRIVESVTKYSAMVERAEDIGLIMDRALHEAVHGRKGPVWIDVPLDIQNARIEPELLVRVGFEDIPGSVSSDDIEHAARSINGAARPIVLIGGGLRASGGIKEFREFVSHINIPVVFSPSAADAFGSGEAQSVGAFASLGGSRAGNMAVQNADYILAIGTKLCSQSTGDDPETFARAAKITVVDIDPNEHVKDAKRPDRIIIADAKDFIQALSACDIAPVSAEWTDKCRHWKDIFDIDNESFIACEEAENRIDLYRFAGELSSQLSEDAAVITDAGLEELIIPSTVKFREGQRCLFPAAQGAMGYAVPAVLGAFYAGKSEIAAVVGDGSIMMNLQELAIIAAHGIPAKIFVINNNMYAVIRKRQRDLFRNRTVGNDPSDGVPAPDFEAIAGCFGFEYRKICGLDGLKDGIGGAMASQGPVICEVMCVSDQKYLHMSYAINEKKKLVKRPLEDMSPFLDRELLKKEMLIPMISE